MIRAMLAAIAALASPAAAGNPYYTYSLRELPARPVTVQLALTEASIPMDHAAHVSVWLGANDDIDSWIQAGVTKDSGGGTYVYLETKTLSGYKLRDLGWYRLGSLVSVQLLRDARSSRWWVRVNGRRYGPVKLIGDVSVQAAGESYDETRVDVNTYRGVVRLPGGRVFYPSK